MEKSILAAVPVKGRMLYWMWVMQDDTQLSVMCAGWRVKKRTSHPVDINFIFIRNNSSISAQRQYHRVHYNCAVEETGNWNLSNVNIYHEATQQQARATCPLYT